MKGTASKNDNSGCDIMPDGAGTSPSVPWVIVAAITDPVVFRFMNMVAPPDANGCRLWTGAKKHWKGYGSFWLDGKNQTATRTSYELFVGPIPAGLFVLHKCDVPRCVNPEHLFLGTAKDNAVDMHQKGRHVGNRTGRPKISEASARAIVSRGHAGETSTDLAREFGIARSTARQIIRGSSWKRITRPPVRP